MERLNEHHPNLGVYGAHVMLEEGRELPAGEVSGFLQRSLEGCRDQYFLTRDLAGILVVARGRQKLATDRPYSMVTYLRLSLAQRDQAQKLWGQG